jgi:DNA polymerase/3'-5' exonuclease PolX
VAPDDAKAHKKKRKVHLPLAGYVMILVEQGVSKAQVDTWRAKIAQLGGRTTTRLDYDTTDVISALPLAETGQWLNEHVEKCRLRRDAAGHRVKIPVRFHTVAWLTESLGRRAPLGPKEFVIKRDGGSSSESEQQTKAAPAPIKSKVKSEVKSEVISEVMSETKLESETKTLVERPPPPCECGNPTQRSVAASGRAFFCCAQFPAAGHCRFFEWTDEQPREANFAHFDRWGYDYRPFVRADIRLQHATEGVRYVDEEAVHPRCRCGVCLSPMTEPCTSACGHSFCRRCVEAWLERSPSCPACRAPLGPGLLREADKALLRMVDELRVFCPNAGCEWQGARSVLEQHLTTIHGAVSAPSLSPASKADAVALRTLGETRIFSSQTPPPAGAEEDEELKKPRKDPNTALVAELRALARGYEAARDEWRARAYTLAAGAIARHPKPIERAEDAVGIPGVGEKIREKIGQFIQFGQSRKTRLKDEDTRAREEMGSVYGIGAGVLDRLWTQGIRSLAQLRENAHLLNPAQQIGLEYREELALRIPRAEVAAIAAEVLSVAQSIDPALEVEACGSYRRGRPDSGDVDLLVTHPDNFPASSSVIRRLVELLTQRGLITHWLTGAAESSDKWRGLCRLRQSLPHRRLDLVLVPHSERPFALLYFTGSALFNRSMRERAMAQGLSLSQHALVGRPGTAHPRGRIHLIEGTFRIFCDTEEDIFRALNMDYVPPNERDL